MVIGDRARYLRFQEWDIVPNVEYVGRELSQVNCSSGGELVGSVTASCSNRGACMLDGECYCAPHYTTHNSEIGCNYLRKSRLDAFAWHMFFGLEFGAGEWYLGNKDYGTFEVVLFIPGPIILGIIFGVFGCMSGEKPDGVDRPCIMCGKFWGALCASAMFCFWGYELWAIATGTRLDGNGVRTY
jgi:hypothetical protein